MTDWRKREAELERIWSERHSREGDSEMAGFADDMTPPGAAPVQAQDHPDGLDGIGRRGQVSPGRARELREQPPDEPKGPMADMLRNLTAAVERLEQENEELRARVRRLEPAPTKRMSYIGGDRDKY